MPSIRVCGPGTATVGTSLVFALLVFLAFGSSALADCSEHELTAVFIVNGIYPGDDLQIETLFITPVLDPTYPSDEELLAAVVEFYPEGAYHYHLYIATAGEFRLYLAPAMDFGAVTIIDQRTAIVVFSGSVVWSGQGNVLFPLSSSHTWNYEPGQPAIPPVSAESFPNEDWWDGWGTLEQLTEAAMEHLRQRDVMHSFADCDDYSVVGYTYTPTIGATWPDVAMQIILVSGHADDPWGIPVAVTPELPAAVHLLPPYPNPFNPRTTIAFDLARAQRVAIAICDLAGRQITVLSDQLHATGRQSLDWKGLDAAERPVAAGAYLVRLETDEVIETRKIMLVR